MTDLPPRLAALRRANLWASLSHFLNVFQPAIGLPHCSISDVEEDLLGSGTIVLPKLIHRLLYILTYDRKINAENFATYLRRQYAKRIFHRPNPLGSDDEPLPWHDLDMMVKLEMILNLCEWQFSGLSRLRSMMGDTDEVSWRLESIGSDAKRNVYWFIGPDRLWVQRPDPNLPPPRRGRPSKAAKSGEEAELQSKGTGVPSFRDNAVTSAKGSMAGTPTPQGPSTRSKASASASAIDARTVRTRNGVRSAKLSVTSRDKGRTTRSTKRSAPTDSDEECDPTPSTSIQTLAKRQRTTRRSRLAEEDGEWQEIPEEWLRPCPSTSVIMATSKSSSRTGSRGGSAKPKHVESKVFGDDESELTELTDDGMDHDVAPEPSTSGPESGEEKNADAVEEVSDVESVRARYGEDEDEEESDGYDEAEEGNFSAGEGPPKAWIEWETVCVTISEWEAFPLQFQGSTSVKEKALFRVLKPISEDVIARLREAERQLQQTLAVQTRKRSSRLVRLEEERLAQVAEKKRKADEAEAHSRENRQAKREQLRVQAEMDRERRAKEREDRLKPKEQQELETTLETSQKETSSGPERDEEVDVVGTGDEYILNGKRAAASKPVPKKSRKHAATSHNKDDWELDCEMCGANGLNVDDGREVACCEKCGRWQHVDCYDREDEKAGRPKRNWNTVDFFCKDCHRDSPTGKDTKITSRKPKENRPSRPRSGAGHPVPPTPALPYIPSGYDAYWAQHSRYGSSAGLGSPAYGSRPPINFPYYQGAFTSVSPSPNGSGPRGGPVSYQGIPVSTAVSGRPPYPTQPTSHGGPRPTQASSPDFGMPQGYFPVPYASLPGNVGKGPTTSSPRPPTENATPTPHTQIGHDPRTSPWASSPTQNNNHSGGLLHLPPRSPVNNLQSRPPPLNPRMGASPYPTHPNGAQGYQQAWPKHAPTPSTPSQPPYPTPTANKYPASPSNLYLPHSGFMNGAYSPVPKQSYPSTSVLPIPSPGQPRGHPNGAGDSILYPPSIPSHVHPRPSAPMHSSSPTASHEVMPPQIGQGLPHASPNPHSPPHPSQPLATSGMVLQQQAQALLAVSQAPPPPPIPSSLPRP